jgi:hypothetical protein
MFKEWSSDTYGAWQAVSNGRAFIRFGRTLLVFVLQPVRPILEGRAGGSWQGLFILALPVLFGF